MLKKILLPLDGSNLAEAVIPYGDELASKLGSEVTLLHVCEPTQPHQLAHNMHLLYLQKTAELMQERLKKASSAGTEPKVRAEQLFGDFTKSLCDYVDKNGIELLIMVAHGFTSLKVRLMGSIVDKIFRLVSCPTLLVRTNSDRRARGKKELLSRLLLPLDGSKHSELALPFAQELALKLKAELSLFKMAKKTHHARSKDDIIGEVGIDDDKLDAAELKRTEKYLKGIEKRLTQQGIKTTTSVSLGDDPAQAITTASTEADADLVVMATRGRSPITAWVPGSIAHKLLNTGDLPLLMVSKATVR